MKHLFQTVFVSFAQKYFSQHDDSNQSVYSVLTLI